MKTPEKKILHWQNKYFVPLSMACFFAVIGVKVLLTSHAATPYVSIQAANGTVSGNATIVSGGSGSYVKFGVSGSSNFPTSRSPYTWPFSWDSVWNIPISSSAAYTSAGEPGYSGLQVQGDYENADSSDYDSVNTSFPVKYFSNARTSQGYGGNVYSDPNMSADGQWNDCAAFLSAESYDQNEIYQGSTLDMTAGGNPAFGGTGVYNYYVPVNIESGNTNVDTTGGANIGCHGSYMSGLGGTLLDSEVTGTAPIRHALKLIIDCMISCSNSGKGYVWPAFSVDAGYATPGSDQYHGGSNPNVQFGSLLALPPSINPSSFSNPLVQKIAAAMQDYGAYIVDNTGWDYNDSLVTNYDAYNDFNNDINHTQFDQLLSDLQVITNNTSSTPGGAVPASGETRYAQFAPVFTDGNDSPPALSTYKIATPN